MNRKIGLLILSVLICACSEDSSLREEVDGRSNLRGLAEEKVESDEVEVKSEESEEGEASEEFKKEESTEEGNEVEEKEEAEKEKEGKEEEEAKEEGEVAEEEEEGGEEEEEGEEEHFTNTDINVSAMLIGAVMLVIALFYLTNWDDDDIRYYSMNIVSMTMSIFSAVLMFQGINECLEFWMEDLNEWVKVMIQYLHCAMYIIAMQVSIGYISGLLWPPDNLDLSKECWTIADGLRADFARELDPEEVKKVRAENRGDTTAKKSVWVDQFEIEVAVVKQKVDLNTRKRRMRCWALLLAHMSGFAAICAGANLQNISVFRTSPLMTLIPVIVTQVFLYFVFSMSHNFRGNIMKGLSKGKEMKRARLCHENVVEAENDVSSLTLSFLGIQAARYAVGGVLPNAEGLEEPEKPHTWLAMILLLSIAIVFAGVAVAMSMNLKIEEEEEEEDDENLKEPPSEPFRERALQVATNGAAMVFAWCLLFGTRWLFVKLPYIDMETMMGRICLALVLSVFSGAVVFVLDEIDDHFRGMGGKAQEAGFAIRTIIQALAILVGFSWEHCFDGGVAAVAFLSPHRKLTKFLLGVAVCFYLVPAWRRHILTKVLALEDMKKQRSHISKKATPKSEEKAILLESTRTAVAQ